MPGLVRSVRSRLAAHRWARAVRGGRAAAEGARGDDGAMPLPPLCDWAWRPAPWAAAMTPEEILGAADGATLTEGVRLFHDCPLAEIALRQVPAGDAGAVAPFALRVEAPRFTGAFLSLAMDLPRAAATDLRRSHIVEVGVHSVPARTHRTFARLNIRQGPNVDRKVSTLRCDDGGPLTAAFDLGFDEVNPVKLEGAWLDLIFERPEGLSVRIDDLRVTRRPRADL